MKRSTRKNLRAVKAPSSAYGKLEARNLLASIFHNLDNGILYIGGDSGNNVGQVSVSNGNVIAQVDGENFSAAESTVTDIIFIGYAGDDTFTNFSGRASSMYGHLGNDTLIGGTGDDNLVGGPGNDVVQGNDGDDRIVGADGNDTLEGGDGNDRIFGTAGQNMIFGGSGGDTIYGSPDIDEIHGDGGTDKIFALGGDDTIYTGAGGIEGGSFDNGDLAMGHGGNDTIFGESGLDILWGGDGNDIMVGGYGENRMHGQAGNDTLTGGAKNDHITGAAGDDTIEGGDGLDFLDAGNGTDTIVYSSDYVPTDVTVNGGETRVMNEVVSSATWVEFGDRRISATQANFSSQDESNFFSLNGYRSSNSQGFVSKPSDLADYALNWSMEMANMGQVTHSSQADQNTLLTNGRTITGENTASVADTGQSNVAIANYFHNFWRNNPVDNGFMLRADFVEVGIGIVKSGGTWWATQIFTD